ncbi:MAG TPA: MauE/DoxX family redox-associated membrane protein [Steroidobacteraceae bacterium]|nr:MauE/DoxX family redox-associated membrane protein [Steroidobacteraceae bacterium]
MLDPAAALLLVGCLSLLFASAALHKLRDLRHFTEVLRAYRVLPEGAVRLAPLVPLAELMVGAGLLSSATRFGAGLGGAALLVSYAAAIGVNLGRGRRDLACGCGGPDDARPIAPWMVGRNLMLALLLLAIALAPWKTRHLLPVDALTVGGGVAIATLLYVSLDQLLGRAATWTAALRGPR